MSITEIIGRLDKIATDGIAPHLQTLEEEHSRLRDHYSDQALAYEDNISLLTKAIDSINDAILHLNEVR